MSKQYKLDSPTAMIGELAKRLSAEYGDGVLPIFREVLKEYGYQTGIKLRKKMVDLDFPGRVTGWMEPIIKAGKCEIIRVEKDWVTVRGCECPLNLEGSSKNLCDNLMGIDEGLVSALAEKDVTVEIEKSLACGEEYCLVNFIVNGQT